MESQRQKKVSTIIQDEMSSIFLKQINTKGLLISVSGVTVSSDLGVAKIYISIFPVNNRTEVFNEIKEKTTIYRKLLGHTLGKVMRQVPEIIFLLDTSLDISEQIDKELKGEGENPLL